MTNEVQLLDVQPLHLAAVQGRVNNRNIGTNIRTLLDALWAEVRASGFPHLGQTVMLYHEKAGSNDFVTDVGVPIDVGVLILEPFTGAGPLIAASTPVGLAATVAYFGPYEQLHEAHDAIRAWCRAHGHSLAGPNWELYGHWTDDPAALRTDVFYLLKPS